MDMILLKESGRCEPMTDQQIIQGLIDRDNAITERFFFVKCQPLFRSIMRLVFNYKVDYDEFVNELYQVLLKDDAFKLRQFEYRSTLMQWLKTVAIRHFILKRDEMIANESKEPIYEENNDRAEESENVIISRVDLESLLDLMKNERYVFIIRKLILEEIDPEHLAKSMGVNTANLYNIKKRAMAALTRVALKDIKNHGKK
jgi:RNA polymerase sigma factor (sigma-70 family)